MDTIFTISQLNTLAREILEESFPAIWVEGEISNFKLHPPSGHMYFSLKDDRSHVRCAMFKMQNRSLTFTPSDGCHVLVRAKVTLYEARGDYQLVIEDMEQSGVGLLLRQFEELKEKLSKAGLFALERKRPIPIFPKRIGIITSSSAAALRDILRTLNRRFPSVAVIIYPTLVQGTQAPPQICQAIQVANARNECDTLILARGGGSLEDLWAFNDEGVARAIFNSQIPIVSGIGHETDFTIADFVADQRASTPTAAAELCTPDRVSLHSQINNLMGRIIQIISRFLQNKSQTLDFLQKRLADPRKHLLQQQERLNYFYQQLIQVQNKYLINLTNEIKQASLKLLQHNPLPQVKRAQDNIQYLIMQLITQQNNLLQKKHQALSNCCHQLNTLSPLATLSRGYAVITSMEGKVISTSDDVNIGQLINTKLAQGELVCEVKEKV